MLVLSRRCDENIVFPGLGITVRILQIKGHQIKIGIDAPSSVVILRQELEHGFHGPENHNDLVPALPRKG